MAFGWIARAAKLERKKGIGNQFSLWVRGLRATKLFSPGRAQSSILSRRSCRRGVFITRGAGAA